MPVWTPFIVRLLQRYCIFHGGGMIFTMWHWIPVLGQSGQYNTNGMDLTSRITTSKLHVLDELFKIILLKNKLKVKKVSLFSQFNGFLQLFFFERNFKLFLLTNDEQNNKSHIYYNIIQAWGHYVLADSFDV